MEMFLASLITAVGLWAIFLIFNKSKNTTGMGAVSLVMSLVVILMALIQYFTGR